MTEILSNGIVIDSSLNLEQALSLRQQIEPPREVLDKLGIADVTYYSFDGNLHQGQVVMDKSLLHDVKGAFDLITQTKFPVFSAIPSMDRSFMTDEEKAKTVNNSNGFSYRRVAGTERLSNHSFGRAVDINPDINPYIKGEFSYGQDYDPKKPGTFTSDSVIVQYLKARGWTWGGDWIDRKDYMHFEKPLEVEESNVFQVDVKPDMSKKDYYEKLLSGISPDAIFVLGGGNRAIDKKDGGKRYTTSSYKGKFYPEKTGGAKARPVAAAELGEFYPDAKIIAMSHRPSVLYQMAEQSVQPLVSPPFAQVIEGDLKRLRVKNEIIEAPDSTSTLTEIIENILLTTENNWQNSVIVTNDYQIERAQKILEILKDDDKRKVLKNQLQFLFASGEETAAFEDKWKRLEEALQKFKAQNYNVIFVSAEDILSMRSPRYRKLVGELREDNGYKNVSEQEKIGNLKIDSGEYNFAQASFKEYILIS